MRRLLMTGLAVSLGAAMTACATAEPSPPLPLVDVMAMMAGASPAESDRIAARVAHRPLGSRDNPVRAHTPAGQRAYLARLRCSDGKAPAITDRASVGLGPYGSMLDVYRTRCEDGASPASAEIFIDMYRAGHVEATPVPGFTIVAP